MGQLFVDTWESQGDIDEATLLANNIYAIFMRLNDINGGHHMDTYFAAQWEQAKNMLRVPYFVYNPWVTGQTNFDWLVAHMPNEARALAIDVEVIYTGYPSTTYAQEVAKFYTLCKAKWNTVIYTGEWFLQYLAYWPTDANYWWAQYPNAFYPPSTQYWTWDTIRNTLIQYPRPFNESKCPGKVLMWQFTGDRLVLPGSQNKIDANLAFMDEQSFVDWCGGVLPPPPPPVPPEPINTHIGITVYRITRFGAPVIVQIIDPKCVDVWVSGRADDFQTVAQTVAKNNATGGANGGGWNYSHPELGTNEYWKSRGTLLDISVIDSSRPWMGFTTDKRIIFGRGVPPSNTTDVVGFDRYLGENGVFNETYRYYKTKDARTFSGATADGKLILCACQGNDMTKNGVPPYGLTFLEEWEVLKEFGCITGGNNDGGSSSQILNKALGSGNLIAPSDGTDAYVINAIIFKATSSAATYTEYATPELWRLKSVVYVQTSDQNDIDQMGCGFSPTVGGFSGVTNWIELNQPEINLIKRVNTGLDSFSLSAKLQYACKSIIGYVWQYMTTTPFAPPWRAWNIVIGSRLPYGSDWNIVKVLGRSSNGYLYIEGIPVGTDLTLLNRETHPWLFHRINASDPNKTYSVDTPKGVMILPIFSPIGRRHAAGEIVATGIWIKPEYLHSKIEEVPPMTAPFEVKVIGVPKYYLGILTGYNDLNIREGPTMFNLGQVGYLKPFTKSQTKVEILELVANAEGYFGKLGKNMWIALYLKSTGKYYTDWKPPT